MEQTASKEWKTWKEAFNTFWDTKCTNCKTRTKNKKACYSARKNYTEMTCNKFQAKV